MKIPKIFHHIWVGPNTISDESVRFINRIKELHPDYEFRLWTNEDLTTDNFSNLEFIHKAKKYAQKADIMRYEILYRQGGIYLDTDFELFKNITELLTHDLVICNEDSNYGMYMSIGFIASIKRHPVIKSCVDNIKFCSLNGQENPICVETGPWYFRKQLKFDETVRMLPTHFMYPVHFNDRFIKDSVISSEAYGIHHWAFSWG